jgi:hypothetical protein
VSGEALAPIALGDRTVLLGSCRPRRTVITLDIVDAGCTTDRSRFQGRPSSKATRTAVGWDDLECCNFLPRSPREVLPYPRTPNEDRSDLESRPARFDDVQGAPVEQVRDLPGCDCDSGFCAMSLVRRHAASEQLSAAMTALRKAHSPKR